MINEQRDLFSKKGLPGQKNLFADTGVPDEMVLNHHETGGARDIQGSDYSGAFDGFTVTSDSDPGL